MAWIETIDETEAEGPLSEIYDDLMKGRRDTGLPNIYKIHSLSPQSLSQHDQLYRMLLFGKSPLKRYMREMIGVHVSRLNDCHY